MNKVQQFAEEYGFSYFTREKFDGIPNLFDGVIILIPTWSQKDFQIIKDRFSNENIINKKSIIFFDIDEFKNYDEIKSLFPDCPVFHQTPVIIEYMQGAIKNFKSGS